MKVKLDLSAKENFGRLLVAAGLLSNQTDEYTLTDVETSEEDGTNTVGNVEINGRKTKVRWNRLGNDVISINKLEVFGTKDGVDDSYIFSDADIKEALKSKGLLDTEYFLNQQSGNNIIVATHSDGAIYRDINLYLHVTPLSTDSLEDLDLNPNETPADYLEAYSSGLGEPLSNGNDDSNPNSEIDFLAIYNNALQ
uniref:Uncharacterized protein n=1 Tax=Myoviridae sp. ctLnO19 TaxID=2825085 RepID=A0A8S5P1Q5_9CAUD|nr:MAG TPA: hypothetical protein [Myoviridae sp. ctLnO19]DAJ69091.1 MAG TPA: hypothetical protein [Caudoviricetes sp.]